MNTKALLATLAFLAFAGYCIWWWNDKRKACNCGAVASTNAAISTNANTSVNDFPLSFQWQNATALQGNGFANFKKDQIKNLGPSDTLVINTWYYEGEANGEQLAMQRADAIKLLFPDVTPDRIKVITEKRKGEASYKTEKFEAASFTVIPNTKSLVKKAGNKVTIYFASNAGAKNVEKEIDDYLNSLVAEMKLNPNETVTATGYTDNVGDDAKNVTLSQVRAEFVKNLMTAKGADAGKVNTVGKGEAEPIATNDTEAGKKLNRRVELIINNQ